jgi:hypothetical protein
MKNEAFVLTAGKTTLVVFPEELLQRMPLDLLATCIRRGKGYRRGIACAKREQSNMTPWQEHDDLD